VAGQPIDEIAKLRGVTIDDDDRKQIDYAVRHAAYAIIDGKGATYYGVGGAISSIVDAIIHNRRTILTVASHTPAIGSVNDVTLSLPRIIGGDGIVATLPTPLSPGEQSALENSASVIRESIDEL
jgi:L-lactate dehydrogenase